MKRWQAVRPRRGGGDAVRKSFLAIMALTFVANYATMPRATATAQLVQSKTAVANNSSVSATFTSAVSTNHLLIVACSSRVNTTLSVTGYTAAKTKPVHPRREYSIK